MYPVGHPQCTSLYLFRVLVLQILKTVEDTSSFALIDVILHIRRRYVSGTQNVIQVEERTPSSDRLTPVEVDGVAVGSLPRIDLRITCESASSLSWHMLRRWDCVFAISASINLASCLSLSIFYSNEKKRVSIEMSSSS